MSVTVTVHRAPDSDIVIRRYHVLHRHEWAVVMVCSDGFFLADSDWGHYGYRWTHTGTDDLRKFLLRIAKNPDYFIRKLKPEDVYDGDATAKAISQHIAEHEVEDGEEACLFEERRSEIEGNQFAFQQWCQETKIGDPYEFGRLRPCHQVVSFVTMMAEELVPFMQKELDEEAAAPRLARQYVLVSPEDCDAPHPLDLTPGGRDDKKVQWLMEMFAKDGFSKKHSALVGYALNGRIQLLSGTHRHEAALRAHVRLPVRMHLRSTVEAAWGTERWAELIQDVPVEQLDVAPVVEGGEPPGLDERVDLARDEARA